MNNTPRLRSAFPSTPVTGQKPKQDGSASGARAPLSDAISSSSNTLPPLIPFAIVDAPSQRLYLLFFYLGLATWRLFDYSRLVSEETDSLWLFMKWVAIDSMLLYGLPGLRIPWLQWSSSTTTLLFIVHALLNAILMFRITIPFESWLIAVIKIVYDQELAIAEKKVKPASILHNSSLILGKQIIHILPEGSAMLNPDQTPFCIGGSIASVNLPIRINQTNPVLIELTRIDIGTNLNETITIASKTIKKLRKRAGKTTAKADHSSPHYLEFPVKKTGLYRLQKVVDESKLEVQRRLSDTLVVRCPSASVELAPQNKCKGDLSDFYLDVEATPPFKVRYSKLINREDSGHVVLSIHPESLASPLTHEDDPSLMTVMNPATEDISWARARSVKVPLNESLGIGGGWEYLIDEVHDALGNVVSYSNHEDVKSAIRESRRDDQQEQRFLVHERPNIAFDGCDSQHPLMAPEGQELLLPIRLTSASPYRLGNSDHTIFYLFTPQNNLLPNQEHAKDAELNQTSIDQGLKVNMPGLYTLKSVNSPYCAGEVLEPFSCMLLNPPKPDLSIKSENIPDNCAGNSIGLSVDLEMTGTPPFKISYDIHHPGGRVARRIIEAGRHRTQLELRPSEAGNYTYKFVSISDAVYTDSRKLEKLDLDQDVRPPSSARFAQHRDNQVACIGESVVFVIHLSGEPPWILEHQVIHNGQSQKSTTKNIQESPYHLKTHALNSGGDHTLVLNSVSDRSKCKVLLEQEAKIAVSFQKPKVSFGEIDGKRSVSALKDKKVWLPIRLQGDSPWSVRYRKKDIVKGTQEEIGYFTRNNDHLEVTEQGAYEIISVHDASCPGLVDKSANEFVVHWIPSPVITIVESSLLEDVDGRYIKKDICEGDEDATEISFSGTAPYTVEYNEFFKPDRGSSSKRSQQLNSGLNSASFKMDTSKAGLYEYEFSRLGDSSYSQAPQGPTLLAVQQRVHPKPMAQFTDIGKTYKYCKEGETEGEGIPITLSGLSPFHLEVEIRHHTNTKPELVNIPLIETNQYRFHMPDRVLSLGTHVVTIRKVQDAHGCQKKIDLDAPHIQISIADSPSISPVETQLDFCVGDRISYSLSGTPPFNVYYQFQDLDRKATVTTTTFRRIAEKPGKLEITGISDQRSTDACKARVSDVKIIHEMPSVRISKGRTTSVDIHEGDETEILFEFGGTPPFEFTYTRSTNPPKGKKSEILETKNEISYEYAKTVKASDEGVYEVVSIKDQFCAFSTHRAHGSPNRKLLTNQ